jgi:hypothetical protein
VSQLEKEKLSALMEDEDQTRDHKFPALDVILSQFNPFYLFHFNIILKAMPSS